MLAGSERREKNTVSGKACIGGKEGVRRILIYEREVEHQEKRPKRNASEQRTYLKRNKRKNQGELPGARGEAGALWKTSNNRPREERPSKGSVPC